MLKLIDHSLPAAPPVVAVHAPSKGKAGEQLSFSVESVKGLSAEPLLALHWDFGDGVALDGINVSHAYTQAGEYEVRVTAKGLGGITNSSEVTVSITGNIATRFVPEDKKRPE
jgi:PKD repeat protein